MAIPQNRKRQHAYEPLQDGRPAKARKTDPSLPDQQSAEIPRRDQIAPDNSPAKTINPPALDRPSSWHYPPEFWDRLSTIPLIRSALEELDRRNRARPAFPPPPPPRTGLVRDLARFARHGGPDLVDLRGYPAPVPRNHQTAGAMSSSSQSRATKSTDPTTATKSGTTKSRKSSTHNPGFDQHLTDHGIHTTWNSQEPDLDAIYTTLAKPRPSLSPSHFSDGAFKTFRKTNAQAKDEDDVCGKVFPTIAGPWEDNDPSTIDVVFGNLEPLTDGTIVAPRPEIALGALPEQLNSSIRNELHHHIIPSTMIHRVIAPNFFVEAKGPDGSAAVMTRQARYDGAVGARAMHSLQNYGQEEPVHDGNAYTFSSTYYGGTGTLQLYAHHATAPTSSGGRPEYHMTQLDSYAMTGKRQTFIEGATAYRNARDLAKQHRDNLIQVANSRYQTRIAAAQENLTAATGSCCMPENIDGQQIDSPCQQQRSIGAVNQISFQTNVSILLIASSCRMTSETAVTNLSHPLPLRNHPRASLRGLRRIHRRALAYATKLVGLRPGLSVPGTRKVRHPFPVVQRSMAPERPNT